MGSASSVVAEELPERIRLLIDVCDRLKAKIAQYDTAILETESKKMFKGHTTIVDELTARSKSQLKKMFETIPQSATEIKALVEGGNQYASFIGDLVKTKLELEIELLKASPDVDSENIVHILGTSTIPEIKEFDEAFIKEKSFSIADFFASNTKEENSHLKKFATRILQYDRDESKTTDYELAGKQVDILHKAGASRLLGVEEDPIIEILASTSRSQCAVINEVYQQKYKMKLERAINVKFKGNAGKLMVLWTQPIPNAFVQCISNLTQRMLVDKLLIGHFIAKYDKDFWQPVNDACIKMTEKSFADFLSKSVSGTYHRALKGWVTLPSPDKGFERILQLYLQSKLKDGVQMKDLMEDTDTIDKFQFLLDKQAQELKLFLVAHKMKIDPQDQAILVRIGSLQRDSPSKMNLETARSHVSSASFHGDSGKGSLSPSKNDSNREMSSPKDHDHNDNDNDHEHHEHHHHAHKPLMPSLSKKFSAQIVQSRSSADRDKLSTKIYDCLVSMLEKLDSDGEGSLSVNEFWDAVKNKLRLTEFGLSENDIEDIRESSDWEMDGRIFYYETLLELSESILTSLEQKSDGNDIDIDKLISNLNAQMSVNDSTPSMANARRKTVAKPNDFSAISEKRSTIINMFPRIPLYFRQYVMDTVVAFDLDCNGFITTDEATALLQTINIPTLTVQQFMENKEKIFPKEAVDIICKEVNAWFGDEQEHYICLIDSSSGSYFWFNTLDESTQWAETQSCNVCDDHEHDVDVDAGDDADANHSKKLAISREGHEESDKNKTKTEKSSTKLDLSQTQSPQLSPRISPRISPRPATNLSTQLSPRISPRVSPRTTESPRMSPRTATTDTHNHSRASLKDEVNSTSSGSVAEPPSPIPAIVKVPTDEDIVSEQRKQSLRTSKDFSYSKSAPLMDQSNQSPLQGQDD